MSGIASPTLTVTGHRKLVLGNGEWLTGRKAANDGEVNITRVDAANNPIFGSGTGAGGEVATGTILPYGGASAPAGYLLCDGAAVSRTTYAALFAAIGTAFGTGDGSTTFNVPNLKGRVLVGKDAGQVEFDTLGETGGEKTHTLATAEMPAHTHATDNPGSHVHGISHPGAMATEYNTGIGANLSLGGGAWYKLWAEQADGAGGHTHTAQSAGGGGAHQNLPPYLVATCIIKT